MPSPKLKLPTVKARTVVDLFSMLLNSVTQTHIFHLQTTSFAAHSALGDFYDKVEGLTDSLIEAYQGKYGIVKGYSQIGTLLKEGNDDLAITYLETLGKQLEADHNLFTDSDLKNILDEIKALVKSTLYKLKNLS